MVDAGSEGQDILKLKRCAGELLRGVEKRSRPNNGSRIEPAPKPPKEPAACDRQPKPQICYAVSPFSPERKFHEVVGHVFKEVTKWLSGVPPLFWVAVSPPDMLAYTYWQSVLLLRSARANGVGHATPSPLELVRRLVCWLKPLVRDFRQEEVHGFLIKTRLDLVANAFFGIQLWAELQSPPVFFSNDFGGSAAFDPAIHWNAADEGVLRAGDECLVVFPAMGTMLAEGERLKPLEAISKPCVLPRPSPNSSLRELKR